MPVVGSQVEQLRAALRNASAELATAVRLMRDVPLPGIGTPSADPPVVEAMGELGSAVSELVATADDCLRVLTRHAELARTSPLPADDGPAAPSADSTDGTS